MTNKYEGHTPEPWYVIDPTDTADTSLHICSPMIPREGLHRLIAQVHNQGSSQKPTAHLIADASTILADRDRLAKENERLREALSEIAEFEGAQYSGGSFEACEALVQDLGEIKTISRQALKD